MKVKCHVFWPTLYMRARALILLAMQCKLYLNSYSHSLQF